MPEIKNQLKPSGSAIRHFSDLIVWQKARQLGFEIFQLTKTWPAEERFSLTDQIRRSSRSVGANIAEAWGKRRYEAAFVAKLSDSDAEAHETEHWLIVAQDHHYITSEQHETLRSLVLEVGRMLGSMISKPTSFLLKQDC